MPQYPQREEVVLSEDDAAAMILDEMTVSIGGLLSSSHPMALIRHIIKKGRRGLTVLAGSAGLELDMLVAGGCVKKAVVALMTGEVITSVGPAFRAAAESGKLEIWEAEESIFAAGLKAAALGLPFLPCRAGVGTSLPDLNPDLKIFKDPVAGETLLAVPALKADVAILHAACADPFGNARHIGTGFGDRALFRAAKKVIVQVEKIVSNEEIRRDPGGTSIPGADAVVRLPFGAHPGSSPGFYLEDRGHLANYAQAAEAAANGNNKPLAAYMDKYVFGPKTHLDYLEAVGVKHLMSLHEF